MSDIAKSSNSQPADSPPPIKCVRVCQNRTCQKQGASEVLEAFEESPVPGVTVMPSGCLGQCGNGPMVVVIPDLVWYSDVKPNEVSKVVEQHLRGGQRVTEMLYYRFHPKR
jgi:(2Fe-2S) ferredoxin